MSACKPNRFFLTAVLLLSVTFSVNAQSVDSRDWPCIQALVPTLEAAVVWPEFIEEEQLGKWRKDKAIRKQAEFFGSLEQFSQAERDAMAAYAEAVPEEQRLQQFNMLADGVLHKFNQRRTHYIKGIKKYSRQQSTVALQIEDFLNQKAELEESQGADAESKMQELDATTMWHQRIFDQRERAIGPLCDAPVELETIAGDILRELAQYLP